MTEKVLYTLLKNGYKEMISRGEETGYRIYYDMTASLVNAVIFVDALTYTTDFHNRFTESFKVGMGSKNFSTNDMLVLLVNSNGANYTEQMSVAHQVCAFNSRTWIYDEDTESLIVYDNQVEEFFGLRHLLESASSVSDEELAIMHVDPPEIDIPVSRKDRLRRIWKEIPKASGALVLINVLVFILCEILGTVIYYYGSVGLNLLTDATQYYRVISSLFLHLNIVHLFSNMLLLYFAGEQVERVVKPVWLLIIFFMSGICGNIVMFVSDYVNGTSSVVIGASGAVYGILGTLLALAIFKRIDNNYAKLQRVIFAIFISIYSGFLEENIANLAHIGGLVMGIILGLTYCMATKKHSMGKNNED